MANENAGVNTPKDENIWNDFWSMDYFMAMRPIIFYRTNSGHRSFRIIEA